MACFSSMPTIYKVLDNTADDDNETDNLTRKALKKLREIETLKQKATKTPEEYTKIRDEDIWRSVAYPPNASMDQTPEEIAERKRKQREKTKIKTLELQLRAVKSHHQEELDLFKKHFKELYQKQSDKITKMKHHNAQLHFELRILKEGTSHTTNIELSTILEKEFHTHILELGKPKQAWHKMMFKYHPDKYKENAELADIFSKILNSFKEKYVN